MKMRSLSSTVALLLLLAGSALGQLPALDMSVWPSTVGWNPYSANGGSATLSGGILTLTSPLNALAGFRAPSTLWATAASAASGWNIEADMQVMSYTDSGAHVATITFRTGIHRCIFDIFTDHIEFFGSSWSGITSYAMDTTDAVHEYILSGSGTHVDVQVDGTLALAADNLDSDTGAPDLDFGDGWWVNSTVTHWTYVGFGPLGTVEAQPMTLGGVKALFR